MENLEIYRRMSEPPKSALKTIGGGKLKGMTDINPQWRYKVMTENFGIVGIGWKYTIDKTWLETAANGEIIANAQVSVFVKQDGEWSDPIVGVGGSKLVARERDGLASNDEAFKMAVTDAFSTSLKMLGVAAAIYEGRWDGSKYSTPIESKMPGTAPTSPSKPAVPDSPELIKASETVNNYIKNNQIDKSFIPKAQMYLANKDLEGLNKVIAYVEACIAKEVEKEIASA